MYLGILVKIKVSILTLLTPLKSQEYRKSHMTSPVKCFLGVHTKKKRVPAFSRCGSATVYPGFPGKIGEQTYQAERRTLEIINY